MDTIAEKLAKWFGSVPFLLFHFVWFIVWITLHIGSSFDEDWSSLTLIVSLEAIFLSLLILRAENVASERNEKQVKNDLKKSEEQLKLLKTLVNRR